MDHSSHSVVDIHTVLQICQLSPIKSTLVQVIQNAPRSSRAGLSGWRYDHFRLLLDNVVTSDVLLVVRSSIEEGKILDSIAALLSAARLIALPNGDIQPTAIGEVFHHITARVICWQWKPLQPLSPFQHGCGNRGH